MIVTVLSVLIPLVMSGPIDASPGDDGMAEWVRSYPQAMAIFRAKNFPPQRFTRDFRECVGEPLRTHPHLVEEIVVQCAWTEEIRQAGERDRKRAAIAAQRREEKRQVEGQEAKARQAERQRDANAHHEEAIDKWLGAVFGYRVAIAEDARAEAKEEIAKQKKYSRLGGVVNKVVMYDAQQQIRASDEIIEEQRQRAKDNRVKLLGREDTRVRRVEECIESNYDHRLGSRITGQDIGAVVGAATSFVVEGQDCLWILLLIRETDAQ
jgi:hypothetical protein